MPRKLNFFLLALLVMGSVLGCTDARQQSGSIPAHAAAKISPQLLTVAQQLEAGTNPLKFNQGLVRADARGRIQVYVQVMQVTGDEIKSLTANGLEQALPSPALHVVQGWVRPQALEALADLPFVTRITPPTYGYPQAVIRKR